MKLRATFLGTGTSQGVPVIGCSCNVCQSKNSKDKRLRSALLLQSEKTTVVIDSGPDFRYQMLRAGVKKLDAVVLTHEHKDHIAGLDDIRAFNYHSNKPMKVYATHRVQEALRREFSYVFEDNPYPGIPRIDLMTITNEEFIIGDIPFLPIEVMHYLLPVLGFRIGSFCYITDAKTIARDELEKCFGVQTLVLNALRKEKHISHFTLDEAIHIARKTGASSTYFTHISHQLGLHNQTQTELPQGFQLAYDQLCFEFVIPGQQTI